MINEDIWQGLKSGLVCGLLGFAESRIYVQYISDDFGSRGSLYFRVLLHQALIIFSKATNPAKGFSEGHEVVRNQRVKSPFLTTHPFNQALTFWRLQ